VVTDTCTYITPIIQSRGGPVVTDSEMGVSTPRATWPGRRVRQHGGVRAFGDRRRTRRAMRTCGDHERRGPGVGERSRTRRGAGPG
jgi:hypothetical protein